MLHKDLDLLIIDTILNDVVLSAEPVRVLRHPPTSPDALGQRTEHISQMIPNKIVAATAVEQMLRKLAKIAPHAVPLVVFNQAVDNGNQVKAAEMAVYKQYGAPFIDITTISKGMDGALWPLNSSYSQSHPPWFVHHRIADTISCLLATVWTNAVSSSNGEDGVGGDMATGAVALLDQQVATVEAQWQENFRVAVEATPPMYGEPYTSLFAACDAPLSRYSAFDFFAQMKKGHATDGGEGMVKSVIPTGPVVTAGNWTLYEDRPNKPGWISNELNSVITFNLKFGEQPRLSINYLGPSAIRFAALCFLFLSAFCWNVHVLRCGLDGVFDRVFTLGHTHIAGSYVGFGVAMIEAPGRHRIFIDAKWEEQVSQTASKAILAFSLLKVKPNTEIDLEIVFKHVHHASDRFKLIEVMSC